MPKRLAALEPAFERGEPEAVSAYYAIDFSSTFKRPEDARRLTLRATHVESSAHIAQAIPGARLGILRDSGHFSYIDASERVRRLLEGFLQERSVFAPATVAISGRTT